MRMADSSSAADTFVYCIHFVVLIVTVLIDAPLVNSTVVVSAQCIKLA